MGTMSFENNQPSSVKQRWYEQSPVASSAVDLFLSLPELTRHLISKQIETHVQYMRSDDDGVKQLGRDRVLSLYQSQMNRRQLDNDPTISNVLRKIQSLPPQKQKQTFAQLLDVGMMVHGMTAALKPFASDPNGKERQWQTIRFLVEVYFDRGRVAALQLMDEVSLPDPLPQEVSSLLETRSVEGVARPEEYVTGDEDGMRLADN